jgi:hypothetical protein
MTYEESQLERIAIALEALVDLLSKKQSKEIKTNLFAPISEFKTYDWARIGATVISSDEVGADTVLAGDREYIRRSPENKYGAAIWFSRYVGLDDQGQKQYERLITFKQPPEPNPLSRSAERLI